MKRFLFAALVAMLGFGLTGCDWGDDDGEKYYKERDVRGEWMVASEVYWEKQNDIIMDQSNGDVSLEERWIFEKNGVGKYFYENTTGTDSSNAAHWVNFDWTLLATKIRIDYEGDVVDDETWTIDRLTNVTMTMSQTRKSGSSEIYLQYKLGKVK